MDKPLSPAQRVRVDELDALIQEYHEVLTFGITSPPGTAYLMTHESQGQLHDWMHERYQLTGYLTIQDQQRHAP